MVIAEVKAIACELPALRAVSLSRFSFVVSADEKTSIQARCRRHPTRPPAGAQAMRVEHEYERGGALACLVAWGRAPRRLFGRCEAATPASRRLVAWSSR